MVSDPPEEEEQDEECEDVGVAYLRILDIMDKRRDMKDVSLSGTCFTSHHKIIYIRWKICQNEQVTGLLSEV